MMSQSLLADRSVDVYITKFFHQVKAMCRCHSCDQLVITASLIVPDSRIAVNSCQRFLIILSTIMFNIHTPKVSSNAYTFVLAFS